MGALDKLYGSTDAGRRDLDKLSQAGGGENRALTPDQVAARLRSLDSAAPAAAPEQAQGFAGNFAAGFGGSLRSQQAAFKDDAALLAAAVGQDDAAAEMASGAAEIRRQSEIDNAGESTLEGIDSVGEFVDYLGYTLGQAGGFIGGMVATGFGAGKVAQVGARKVLRATMHDRLEAIIKDRAGRGVKQAARVAAGAARRAETMGQTAGAVASSIAVNTGLISGDIYDETGELRPAVALSGGIAAGALDSILPVAVLRKVGGNKAVEDVAWNIVKDAPTVNRYLTAATKGFGVEGGTEAAQEIVNMYAAAYARTNGMADAAAAVANDPQFASRFVNSLVAGGIGGAAFGAGGEAFKGDSAAERQKMLDRIHEDLGGKKLEDRIAARVKELAEQRAQA